MENLNSLVCSMLTPPSAIPDQLNSEQLAVFIHSPSVVVTCRSFCSSPLINPDSLQPSALPMQLAAVDRAKYWHRELSVAAGSGRGGGRWKLKGCCEVRQNSERNVTIEQVMMMMMITKETVMMSNDAVQFWMLKQVVHIVTTLTYTVGYLHS
jgi:hypothetical protein